MQSWFFTGIPVRQRFGGSAADRRLVGSLYGADRTVKFWRDLRFERETLL